MLQFERGEKIPQKKLIEQCPDALRVRNLSGELPLDIAVGISSLSLLSQIVHAWPGACKHVLQNVKHASDFQQWDWIKIELLLLGASGVIKGGISGEISEGFSEESVSEESGVDSTDENETGHCSLCENIDDAPHTECPPAFLPLHVALQYSNSTAFMNCVLKKCPDLVTRRDVKGRYPLHIAASRGDLPTAEIGLPLLKANPKATKKRDSHGMLPLHTAICKHADVIFIRELLRSNPVSGVQKCKVKNPEFTNEHLLALAVKHGCCLDIQYMLIRSDPALIHD